AKEPAYIHVNEKLIDRVMKNLNGVKAIRLLELAAGTGLPTYLMYDRAKKAGVKLVGTLLDLDLPALFQAKIEVAQDSASYIYASADTLPFDSAEYDAVFFANGLHLLDGEAKRKALDESYRVLKPGGLFAMNTTFYDGAYPEESKPFYGRWIRRSIVEINQRLPHRDKGEKVQAMEFLTAENYRDLINGAGFKIVESRERRVLLSQAAVRAISSYKDFAMGALHATEEDAEEAAKALQATVKQTFRDLKMKYLPRTWLEIIAVKA
ncbi:MAG TPA: methyltransferase domain-containing protein, partial [Dehalococcoidia bacterium]|nr:methyltransferase domain-containing protein [Dehalococcoidia bacterium]